MIQAKIIELGKSDGKREAIVHAAVELFSEQTYEGTRMPEVAGRAHVAAGTIYHYFEGKEGLVNAVYQMAKLEMKEYLVDTMPGGLAAQEGFAWMWRRLWECATDHPAGFTFLETHHHADYLNATSRAVSEEFTLEMMEIFSRYAKAGELKPLAPETLISMSFGAFIGLWKSVAAGAIKDTEELRSASGEAAWAMIRA